MPAGKARAHRDTQAGFTLFELIIVLMILAFASAFAVPAIQSGWESRQVRQGTRRVAALMRVLREQAVRRGIEQELILDADGMALHWGNQTTELPDGIEIEGVRGGWRDEDGGVRVLFYPNGGTTGLSVLVSGPSESGLKFSIDLDPLLGAVVIRQATG